jgi:hypothetical protein
MHTSRKYFEPLSSKRLLATQMFELRIYMERIVRRWNRESAMNEETKKEAERIIAGLEYKMKVAMTTAAFVDTRTVSDEVLAATHELRKLLDIKYW